MCKFKRQFRIHKFKQQRSNCKILLSHNSILFQTIKMATFIISMEKNVGKRTMLKKIIETINSAHDTPVDVIVWNGVDKSIYDANGILLNSFGHDVKTRAAKEAKLKLFQYFLDNCQQKYLVLFEEDIILHKNFCDYYKNVIDFANNTEFKLIYLGVSCSCSKEPYSENTLKIQFLPQNGYRYSGAYGVIIHRSILQSLINRSNDPTLYNRPFDVYTLGHVQARFPKDCYICQPQLVVPDISISDIRNPRSQNAFWELCHVNKSEYILPQSIPMYVLTDTNEQKIKQFIGIVSMFIPYVIPIFVCDNDNEVIEKTYGDVYNVIHVSSVSATENVDEIIDNDKYVLTNIYVNWTKNITNIFDTTENIKYDISHCPRCSNNISSPILNGLTIVNNKNTDIHIGHNKELFYSIGCKINGTEMHCL